MPQQIKARRIVALAKIEMAYGTDAVPTGAANAILVSSPKLTPMEADRAERSVVRPYMGNAESIPVGVRVKFDAEVELASSGTAGTAPGWGPLLRACGFAETITAGVKVEYTPVSDAHESASMYVNMDGVQHKMLGARGTVSFDWTAGKLPMLKFQFTGVYGGISDAALPTVQYTPFQTPLPVDAVSVASLALHGYSPVMQSLSVDIANAVVHRSLPGGSESVVITDRKPSGSIVVEATRLADKDWYALAKSAVTGALSMVHGKTAGKIIEIAAPAVQVGAPDQSESDGILMLTLPLTFVPGAAGNDEFKLIVR